MKKVIYKYSVSDKDSPNINITPPGEAFEIIMVRDAKILSLQAQSEMHKEYLMPFATGKLWCLCDSGETRTEIRKFRIIQTGKEFELTERDKFIGTYQLYNGEVVLHLFEVLPLN